MKALTAFLIALCAVPRADASRHGAFDERFFCSRSVAPVPVYRGEAAWFKCDDNAASVTLIDSGTNAQHAANSAADTADRAAAGVIGGALVFQNDEFATAAGAAAASALSGSAWSIAFWVKRSVDMVHAEFFCVKNNGDLAGYAYYNADNAGLRWHNGAAEMGSGLTFGVDEWTHLALVRDGNAFTAYQNGVSILTGSREGVSPVTALYLGGVGTYYEISRTFDDIRIFAYGLSESDVAALYNGGAGRAESLAP